MNRKPLLMGIVASMFFLAGCFEVLSIPTLSADGDKLAFLLESPDGQSLSLQVLNMVDGSVQEMGNPESLKAAFDWNPQAHHLAYVEVDAAGQSHLMVAELSGENREVLVLSENVWVNQLAYSPNGNFLALSVSILAADVQPSQLLDFSSDLNPAAVYVAVLDVNTGALQEIMREASGDTPSLAWSPEGSRLAYAFDGHVYSYDLVAAAASELSWGENLSLRSPSWLSETKLVVLSAPDPEGEGPTETEIVIYDLVNGREQSWVVAGSSAVPTASPDGRYIAFLEGHAAAEPELSNQGYATATSTVMLLEIASETIQAIYAGVSLDRPLWSQDSQTLYISNGNPFSMNVDNRRRIFALDIQSGEATMLYEGALASSSLPGWFPPQEATESP